MHVLQSITCQGQRKTIGYEITYDDVQRKLRDTSPIRSLIMKGEMLVEEIAQNAAKEIVAKRRYPLRTAKYIVEHQHNGSTKQGIDHSYNEEGDERLIEYSLLHNSWYTSPSKVSTIP